MLQETFIDKRKRLSWFAIKRKRQSFLKFEISKKVVSTCLITVLQWSSYATAQRNPIISLIVTNKQITELFDILKTMSIGGGGHFFTMQLDCRCVFRKKGGINAHFSLLCILVHYKIRIFSMVKNFKCIFCNI